MKATLELTIDEKTGEPIIEIRHHDRSGDLEQKLLGKFIEDAVINGIKITHPSGYLETGTKISWENYEIRTK